MTGPTAFHPGVVTFLQDHMASAWRGARVGLVSHDAAVDAQGTPSWRLLLHASDVRLAALFGPEHGFRVAAAAGQPVPDGEPHPSGLPLFSLYGQTRAPTPDTLARVDALVLDLQDLGARPYTYVSTLRLVLEAAAQAGKPVLVADRPIPLPFAPDGPPVEPGCESFVAAIPAPLLYAMTPGETARWMHKRLGLTLDLRVAPLRGYRRGDQPTAGWPPWVPPSPRIRTWHTATCYAATVACEALPALDYGSGTPHAFEVLGTPSVTPQQWLDRLSPHDLPGVRLEPFNYTAASGAWQGRQLHGIRLRVTQPAEFRPAHTAVHLLAAAQALLGPDALWSAPGTRPGFFDQLLGGPATRTQLQSGAPANVIAATWTDSLRSFAAERESALLYASG
jgi:uncharacterized protein YbbC (DUF1343 family)